MMVTSHLHHYTAIASTIATADIITDQYSFSCLFSTLPLLLLIILPLPILPSSVQLLLLLFHPQTNVIITNTVSIPGMSPKVLLLVQYTN